MKIIICLALVVASYALPSAEVYPVSDEVINKINSMQSNWTAGRNFPVDTTMDQLRKLAGTRFRSMKTLPTKIHDVSLEDTIPEFFDAREEWPDCPSIVEIWDQGSCASCWAVAAVGAMADRICIHSNGEKKVKVSAQDLLTCCTGSQGCDGGWMDVAWQYWIDNGIVSGGLYGETDGCRAYSVEPCNHRINGSKQTTCETYGPTPACVKQCDSSSLSYENELTFGREDVVYTISTDETQIQLEIMKNGPVEAGFFMYSDFYTYKSGVYQPTDGFFTGGHAIKIIGWGEENGTPYWLGVNSFNDEWGENGFFKISREDKRVRMLEVYGGLPKL
uniref:Cathepsin B n=1 Tax=Anoplophora glabripennis TaxID=217634 RepID=V5G6P4_ANOGL